MIQNVSNGYYGYQNIAPMQNPAYSAQMFAEQPQQPSVDTVQFKGQQQPEKESFVSRNLGKIILSGLAIAATAYFTHGKLWGKATEEVAENTAKNAGKGAEHAAEDAANKGAEEVGEKGAGVASQEGSVTNNTSQIQSEQINDANVQKTAKSNPVTAVLPKTREQLGIDLAESSKENERKAFITRGLISKLFSEDQLAAQFDANWEPHLKNKSIEGFQKMVERALNTCANGGEKSFGLPWGSVGYQNPIAPTFIEYSKLLADEMGYKITNFKEGKMGDIQFDFSKK